MPGCVPWCAEHGMSLFDPGVSSLVPPTTAPFSSRPGYLGSAMSPRHNELTGDICLHSNNDHGPRDLLSPSPPTGPSSVSVSSQLCH